jgi:hypothetical protein
MWVFRAAALDGNAPALPLPLARNGMPAALPAKPGVAEVRGDPDRPYQAPSPRLRPEALAGRL